MNRQKRFPPKVLRPQKSAQQGVVLLEALIAILIFSMGVLAIVGLQAAMIKNTSDSKFRTDASYIAQQWVGRMWIDDPLNLPNYVNVDPNIISNLLPNGKIAISQPTPGVNQYVITITWRQPGESLHNFTTSANIN